MRARARSGSSDTGDDLRNAQALLSTVQSLPGLEYDLLMSTDLLESQPQFSAILAQARVLPRFFSGALKGGRNLLLGHSAVIVGRPGGGTSKLLSGHAGQLGVRVLTSQEAINGGLRPYASKRKFSAVPRSKIVAGPHDEWVKADGSVDWAFIVHQNARDWILDAICREIGSRQSDSWKVVYYPETSPKAKIFFFSHYLLLENYLKKESERLEGAKTFVWYTHPREENPVTVAKLLLAFESVTKVIFACESNRQIWLERGLPEEKTVVVLGAADPTKFLYHERGNGLIGLSSSFYERKNPDGLLELVKLLPHRQFLLLGRNWNRYALFEELKALPNFTYQRALYRDYPDLYSKFDVFLSMSSLEGGPIPLIEAMMSNAVPVASRTGFAPDLIRHGENGLLFDLDASPGTIVKMIEEAFAFRVNVRATVEGYDWESFSSAIVQLAK